MTVGLVWLSRRCASWVRRAHGSHSLSPICPHLRTLSTVNEVSAATEFPPLDRATDVTKYLKQVETKWRPLLAERWKVKMAAQEENGSDTRPRRYILSMFPYPSGNLHMGHVRIYTCSDVIARFNDMSGHSVIHPMGFDSFGLPAENAARDRGLDPHLWTENNCSAMRNQLDDLALQVHWRESTSDPPFYKWTQWLFLQLYNAGMAYKTYSEVNWDPVDETVLADEQVDDEGRSWRSGAPVERRILNQWFIKTSPFLRDVHAAAGIQMSDYTSWGSILGYQRGWLGDLNGLLFYFTMEPEKIVLPIFTHHEDLLTREGTYVAISPEHWIAKRGLQDSSTAVYRNFNFRINIRNDLEFPATNAILANDSSPGLSDHIPQKDTNRSATAVSEPSSQFGGFLVSRQSRDWLISRQRFWGTPIPIIDCPSCGQVPVPLKDLPVILPTKAVLETLTDRPRTGIPLLDEAPDEWLTTRCPQCDHPGARREGETCDTFFDSSWYFLRYFTSPAAERPYDPQALPVWLYVGGKEHTRLHLFYARVICRFLASQSLLHGFHEPFERLLAQGVLKGESFRTSAGRYVSREEASRLSPYETTSLVRTFEKMSKSKLNGVEPREILDEYGVDATRLCILSEVNPISERKWSETATEFRSIISFLRRVTLVVKRYIESPKISRYESTENNGYDVKAVEELFAARNYSITLGTFHMKYTYHLRQFIHVLIHLQNQLKKFPDAATVTDHRYEYTKALQTLLILMNPILPHLSEELWSQCHFDRGHVGGLCADQSWPQVDRHYPIPVKIFAPGKRTIETNVPRERFNELFTTMTTADFIKTEGPHPPLMDLISMEMDNNSKVVKCELFHDLIASIYVEVPKKKRPEQQR